MDEYTCSAVIRDVRRVSVKVGEGYTCQGRGRLCKANRFAWEDAQANEFVLYGYSVKNDWLRLRARLRRE